MKLSILAEIGILKFPQETYRSHELWLLVDRTRYTWEAIATDSTSTYPTLMPLQGFDATTRIHIPSFKRLNLGCHSQGVFHQNSS